jgi:hypothetical protein
MSALLKMRLSSIWMTGLVATLVGNSAWADDSIPISAQAVLFKKILSYDNSIGTGQDKVVVPYDNLAGRSVADEIARALTDAGLKASTASVDQLGSMGADVAAVYVIAGSGVSSIKEICSRKKVLTISGSAYLAESGDVSVAVRRIEGGRTEIVVHFRRAQDEKQQLASSLLGLARVIR